MKNVLFWTASHLPEIGGFQQSTYRLAKSLKTFGWTPVFLTRETGATFYSDIETIRLSGDTVQDWVRQSSSWLLSHANKFDLIHTIDLFYDAINIELRTLKEAGPPNILKIPTAGCLPRIINQSNRNDLLVSANCFSVLNSQSEKELLSLGIGPDRIRYIPNGINSNDFLPGDTDRNIKLKLKLPEGVPIILFAGRFVARKRLDILLESARRIGDRALFVLVGAGLNQDMTTENLVREKSKQMTNVRIVKARAELIDFYHASDVHILLAEREGMPNSILESMSCAIPTIGTDIPGINDLISHRKDGLLVPVADVQSTTDSITALINDKELRKKMGSKARAKVLNYFDVKIIAGVYDKLYQDLISGAK